MDFISNLCYFLVTEELTETSSRANIITDCMRSICMFIDKFLYKMISFSYNLFVTISKINILDIDETKNFIGRVNSLLGIILLFVSIFFLLKLLLNPDRINDKEQGVGSLIKKIIISVVLIGFMPTIFSLSRELQDAVIESNVIGKVILGTNISDSDVSNAGRIFGGDVFLSFYQPNEIVDDEDGCLSYSYLKAEITTYGSYSLASDCINQTAKVEEPITGDKINTYVMDFDALPSVIVGIVLLWILFVYSVDLGIRAIQLTFLEIISPLPIMMNVLPKKDNMFQRWVKQIITTYLDVFIRIAVMYFIVYMCKIIWQGTLVENLLVEANIDSYTLGLWIKIILIIGLLAFAKRLPKLVQELVGKPNAATIGYGLTNDGLNIAGGALAGALIGSAGSRGWGKLTSGISGAFRGGAAGFKQGSFSQNFGRAKQAIVQSNYRDEWFKEQGMGLWERTKARAALASGKLTKAERIALQDKAMSSYVSAVKATDVYKRQAQQESQAELYGPEQIANMWRTNGMLEQDEEGHWWTVDPSIKDGDHALRLVDLTKAGYVHGTKTEMVEEEYDEEYEIEPARDEASSVLGADGRPIIKHIPAKMGTRKAKRMVERETDIPNIVIDMGYFSKAKSAAGEYASQDSTETDVQATKKYAQARMRDSAIGTAGHWKADKDLQHSKHADAIGNQIIRERGGRPIN